VTEEIPDTGSTRAGEEDGRLGSLARLFLKLGFLAFGGPAAHVAMMEDEVVARRRWLSRPAFLDILGATNLIPGPNSTEMAMHVGWRRAGTRGLVVAGACFIGPAALITGVLAWAYLRYGARPEVGPFLFGIKPAVLAVILIALWRLARVAARTAPLAGLGAAVALAALAGVNEILALLAGGLLGTLAARPWSRRSGPTVGPPPDLADAGEADRDERADEDEGADEDGGVDEDERADEEEGGHPGPAAVLLAPPVAAGWMAAGAPLWTLGLFFLKVGAVLYGSGYVLVAFLEGDVVGRYGWLTRPELLDAIAIGQFTPGPVLSTATFVGYLAAGPAGAVVATIGIFLPSFVFVSILGPLVPRLRESAWTAAFLDAVNASAVGLIAAVTVSLGVATLVDWRAWAIGLAAAAAGLIGKVGSVWLVLGGAVIGWALGLF
jgi:chromate transporter